MNDVFCGSESSSESESESEDDDDYDEDPDKTREDIKEIIRDTRLMKFERAIIEDAGINSLARMRDCTERQLKRVCTVLLVLLSKRYSKIRVYSARLAWSIQNVIAC